MGCRTIRPNWSSRNLTLVPAAIPCLRRSSAGTTSWPFEVNVALASFMTYILPQVRRTLWATLFRKWPFFLILLTRVGLAQLILLTRVPALVSPVFGETGRGFSFRMTRSTTSLRSVAQGRLRADPAFAENAKGRTIRQVVD